MKVQTIAISIARKVTLSLITNQEMKGKLVTTIGQTPPVTPLIVKFFQDNPRRSAAFKQSGNILDALAGA